MMPARRKREGRVLFVDIAGGRGGGILAIVFRGGWIDCIAAVRDPGSAEAAASWLESQGFMLEVTGIDIGPGLPVAWGEAEAGKLSEWGKSRGFTACKLGSRNAAQAHVISSGLEDYLVRDRTGKAAEHGSPADR